METKVCQINDLDLFYGEFQALKGINIDIENNN